MKRSLIALSAIIGLSACEAYAGGHALAPMSEVDSSAQWAYDGQPLYLWINDRRVGDTTDDGVGGNWHLARP